MAPPPVFDAEPPPADPADAPEHESISSAFNEEVAPAGGWGSNRHIWWAVTGCIITLLCLCGLAAIGGGLAYRAGLFNQLFAEELAADSPPEFGATELGPGFSPAPFTRQISVLGRVNLIFVSDLPADCTGYVAESPTMRLLWTGGTEEVEIAFTADEGDDSVLVVRDPAGTWICNDDFSGVDPAVVIVNPASGEYDIWGGSYDEGQIISGMLVIAEPVADTGALNPFAPPRFGAENLSAGFGPQPLIIEVVSGGNVAVDALNLGFDCTGYVSDRPDFRLEWSGVTDVLHISFTGDDEEDDATLVVLDPVGDFHCNDDFNELNPLIEINRPPAGAYLVWIGSFDEEEFMSGDLEIEE